MIKEHLTGDLVTKINKDAILKMFNEVTKDYRVLKGFYKDLQDFKNGDIDEDDILDIFDSVKFVSAQSCAFSAKLQLCTIPAVNFYLGKTAKIFAQLESKIRSISDTYCAPDDKELDELIDLTYKVLSGICFLFWTDFDCFTTNKSLDAGEEPVFDEILYNHFAKFSVSQEERHTLCSNFARDVKENAAVFKIKLTVFDEAPEKEQEFSNIMGPDIALIDETLLTMQLVDELLGGNITPEQLLAQCGEKVDMDAEEEETIVPIPGNADGLPKKIEV